MGRHSTGKNNYSLSKGLIALLVVIALVIAAVVLWLMQRGDSNSSGEGNAAGEQQECVSGDLELPLAAANKAIGEKLVGEYAASNPVVRDYCIKPTYVDSIEDAAVYIAPRTPISEEEIKAAGRSAATNEPPAVHASPVGLAAQDDAVADAASSDISKAVFATDEQPEASALVANQLADSEEAATEALDKQRVGTTAEGAGKPDAAVATTEDNAPEGSAFIALDGADLVYNAIPLNTTENVNEEQTRAAQAFTDYAGKMFIDASGEAEHTDLSTIGAPIWKAAAPTNGTRVNGDEKASEEQADAEQSASAEPANTIFVLDTSIHMSEFNDTAATAIDEIAPMLTDGGHQVALWNYSSPLTPGVTKGYRANVALTDDPNSVIGTAHRFINGGQPQTREAVRAAVDYAVTESAPDHPVRIVLITSGSADIADDYALQALADAKDNGVSLTIVRTGNGEPDEKLAETAERTTDAASPADLNAAIRSAAAVN